MQNKSPANWEEKTLGEVCIVQRGSSPRPIKNFLTVEDDGVNWIRIGDCFGKYVTSTSQKITKEGAKKSRQVQKGDFIISNSMSYGKPYILKIDGYIHDGWFVLKLDKNLINTDFFYYLLSSNYIKEQYDKLATGAIVQNISSDLIKKVQFLLPPLSEQERIVQILDEAFENIEKAKQNTLKNLNNAKELFESHLNTLLCYFEINGKYKHLSELTTVKDGTHESPKYVKIGIPFITQKNIKDNGLVFITQDTKYISEEDHSKFYQRSNVEQGDILISMIGANRGMACLVDIKNIFSIKNVGLIKSNSNINMKYLLYFLKSKFAKKYIDTKSKDGAQEFISLTSLRNFPILYVDIKDQEYIVQQLDRTKENIQKLEQIYNQKLKSLEELKQSILQKAFNGEL